MRPADTWKDYELLDATDGNRLERWGETILIRPDPQVVWKTPKQSPLWAKADAVYHRSNQGGGEWEYKRRLPEKWKISCGEGEDKLTLIVSPTGFKHTGVFPEQAVNWAWYAQKIRAAGRPVKVLNLFGYTGGATLACAAAGATVCHVDASKGIVAWGKDNAAASGLADRPIRWLVDDCAKFVAREKRRGNTYDGIIMDPPSYGRGPGGEIWKLEDCIYDLISQCEEVLSDTPLFFAVNSYTTGLSPAVMEYMLKTTLVPRFGGETSCDEIGLPVSATVYVEGMDTADDDKLYDIRQTVGMVFQNPDNQIVATVVEEDVAFALENLGVPPEEMRRRVDDSMKMAGIYEYRERAPHNLSGGQKQRVAIAGVVAMRPDCLILDEATAMLDPRGREQVMQTIHYLNRNMGITVVSITHYMEEAAQADRVLVMSKGHVVMEGTPKEVFSQTEKVRSLHLDVPQAAELRDELVKAGIPMPEGIIDTGECAQALYELLQ